MARRFFQVQYDEFILPSQKDQLPKGEAELIDGAWDARKNAYGVYSGFKVGSAVLTDTGEVIKGANQENIIFSGSCAERAVLDAASSAGFRNAIKKIAIAGGPEDMDIFELPEQQEDPVTPCGMCRQDIQEVEGLRGEPVVILCASRNLVRRFVGIEMLLPFGFGPSNSGLDQGVVK